jgi:hypothetical protein
VSRLTKKVKGKGKAAPSGISQEYQPAPRPKSAAGVVVDGAVYPLAGEPPIAQSRGWGDMSWTRW